MIRDCRADDAEAICAIYNPYVRETVITFEEKPVAVEEMARRIRALTEGLPWLVWEADGTVLGYAYAAPWRERSAYRYSAESTIYIDPRHTGCGIGTGLYEALLHELRRGPTHCVIGAIALPNPESIALHEKVGFEKLGELKQLGFKLHRWIDVGYWQLVL